MEFEIGGYLQEKKKKKRNEYNDSTNRSKMH